MTECANCGDDLPDDAPRWMTLCRDCYIRGKREEQQLREHELIARALRAEQKVELAKKVVLDLTAKLRAAEGALRAAQGKVGLGQGGDADRGLEGLDVATLKRIRRLVHPDKHGGSKEATELSQLINQLIERG